MSIIVPSRIVDTIDKVLPQAKAQQEDEKQPLKLNRERGSFLRGLLEMLSQIPDHLLPSNPERYVEYVAGKEAIRHQLEVWITQPDPMRELPGYAVSPLTLIRRALSECPDEAAPPEAARRFEFLNDADLERSLALDVSSAEGAMSRSEFKVAIVMAGASIEALLLWKITRARSAGAIRALVGQQAGHFSEKARRTDILEWALSDLIVLAGRFELIDERAVALAGYAKDFRNLIHPGREQRTGVACTRSNAATAIAALETIIEQVE